MRLSRPFRSVHHSFVLRGAPWAALALVTLLPVSGCGGAAEDSGDGDGDTRGGDGDTSGGDGDGDGLPASLNPNDLIVSLTPAEIGELCDAVAAKYGGYGVTLQCGDGVTISSTENRETCVAESMDFTSDCTVTVGDTLDCADELTQTCSFAACLPLFSCVP